MSRDRDEPCSGTHGGADRRALGRIPRFFWRGLERFRPFRQRYGLRPPIPEHPGWYPDSGHSSDSRREPEWPLPRLPRGALVASWEVPSHGVIAKIRELGGAICGEKRGAGGPAFPSGCEWRVPLLKFHVCRDAAVCAVRVGGFLCVLKRLPRSGRLVPRFFGLTPSSIF